MGFYALHGTKSLTLDVSYIICSLILLVAFGLMEIFENDFKIQNEFKRKLRKKYPLKAPGVLLAKYILGPARSFSKKNNQKIIGEVLSDLKKIQEKLQNLIKSDLPFPKNRNQLDSKLLMLDNTKV